MYVKSIFYLNTARFKIIISWKATWHSFWIYGYYIYWHAESKRHSAIRWVFDQRARRKWIKAFTIRIKKIEGTIDIAHKWSFKWLRRARFSGPEINKHECKKARKYRRNKTENLSSGLGLAIVVINCREVSEAERTRWRSLWSSNLV